MKRNTIQRYLVLEAVNCLHSHATANDIYKLVSEKYPGISQGTVYRNLEKLAEEKEIRKLSIPGEPERFDHIYKEHYHVKCEKCGRLFDVDMECISGLEEKIRDSHGFRFTGYNIFFTGICPDCTE